MVLGFKVRVNASFVVLYFGFTFITTLNQLHDGVLIN